MNPLKTSIKISKITYLIIITVLLSSSLALSFVNIENLRQSDELGFLGSLGFKLNGASGNTNKFNTALGFNNIYRNSKYEYLTLVNYAYSELSGEKNTHKGQVHGRFTTKISKLSFIEIFSQIEFDDFKSLKYRKILGLGLRYKLLSSAHNKLALGTGVFYESEEFEDLTRNITYRYNFYFSYKGTFSKNSEINFVNYLQPATDNFKDLRVKSHLNLNIKVSKSISLSNELRYSFDSNLKKPTKKGDLVYLTGFNLKY